MIGNASITVTLDLAVDAPRPVDVAGIYRALVEGLRNREVESNPQLYVEVLDVGALVHGSATWPGQRPRHWDAEADPERAQT